MTNEGARIWPLPAAKRSRSVKKIDSMITLSLIQTMNLLEPDTRILTYDEVETMTEAQSRSFASTILHPWSDRIAHLVDTHVEDIYIENEKEVEIVAQQQQGQPPSVAIGNASTQKVSLTDSGAQSSPPTKRASTKCVMVRDAAPLCYPFAEGIVYPDSMSIAYNGVQNSGLPPSALFWNGQTLHSKQQEKDHLIQQQLMFGRATQRIGHRVLAGSFDLLGGLVTYPGTCLADAEAQKGPPLGTDEVIDTENITHLDSNTIRGAAAVYVAWKTPLTADVVRLATVDLVRMTLAQYIAHLEDELALSKAQKMSDVKHELVEKAITELLNIAKSYTGGDAPATTYVLEKKNVDPNKVMLELYSFRALDSHAESVHAMYESIFGAEQRGRQYVLVPEGGLAELVKKEEEKKAKKKAILSWITERQNETSISITVAPASVKKPDEVSRVKMRVAVPIISCKLYNRELMAGEFAEHLHAVLLAAKNGGPPPPPNNPKPALLCPACGTHVPIPQ